MAVLLVNITIRAYPHQQRPDFAVDGHAPYAGCPLAATPIVKWSDIDKRWNIRDGWVITHVPTGYSIRGKEFDTVDEALEFISRLDPQFPAWPLAIGGTDDIATIACHQKFLLASAA